MKSPAKIDVALTRKRLLMYVLYTHKILYHRIFVNTPSHLYFSLLISRTHRETTLPPSSSTKSQTEVGLGSCRRDSSHHASMGCCHELPPPNVVDSPSRAHLPTEHERVASRGTGRRRDATASATSNSTRRSAGFSGPGSAMQCAMRGPAAPDR